MPSAGARNPSDVKIQLLERKGFFEGVEHRRDALDRLLAEQFRLAVRALRPHRIVRPQRATQRFHRRLRQPPGRTPEQREALATPRRAIDLLAVMFRKPLRGDHYYMATGECIAHLNWLLRRERVSVARGGDGVDWYRAQRP